MGIRGVWKTEVQWKYQLPKHRIALLVQPERQQNQRRFVMRKEYDLTRLKVKRRGPLEGLQGVPEAPEEKTGQVQVTIMLESI